MSVWICLVCASLLSCAGQLCQKQAGTRPSRRGRRSRHILFWLGMALLCLGCGMLLWLSVLQSIPVSIAYPMLSLNFVWVTLAGWGIWRRAGRPSPLASGVGLIVVGIVILGTSV
ncbi:4-amino-4-deoxy-L-arabinose-phosphoundecaprenol flippase subunit ArnE [Klebsiella pneumoniae]